MRLPEISPEISPDLATRIVAAHWGITPVDIAELPAERDRNFVVTDHTGRRSVLKISAADATRHRLDLQATLMDQVREHTSVRAPAVVPTTDGAGCATFDLGDAAHLVRLLTWVEGRPFAEVRPHTRTLLRRVGTTAGAVTAAIADLAPDRGEFAEPFLWDLRHVAATIDGLLGSVPDPDRRRWLEGLVVRCTRRLDPCWGLLPTGLIHGDLNDHNLIVDAGPGQDIGVIDFGDAHVSVRIAEAAIAAAYGGLGLVDPVEAVVDVASGYHAVISPGEEELEGELAAITPLAVLRLALSVVISAERAQHAADRPYLRISEDAAWTALSRFDEVPLPVAELRVRHGCGLVPSRTGRQVASWLESHRDVTHGVLGIPMSGDSVCTIDWSVTSVDADHPSVAPSMEVQTRQIATAMSDHGASVGVGRQGEPRIVYAAPEFAVPTNRGPGWRTVHLGVDLSCPAGTEVRALWDGVVARVDDDAVDRGYGPVVTLRHEPDDGPPFYTLYGHLGRSSTRHLRVGEPLAGGARIGVVGVPEENGGWTPHLHFQVMADHLEIDGPFPGVAMADEWGAWASVCPSPHHALGLPAGMVEAPSPDDAALTEHHRRRLPPSQRVSYDEPLVAVRGHGPWLYDSWGRGHLDAVNNVAHVGHQHPRVVAAQRRQAALIDTNTRYPHPARTDYLTRLANLFPDPLDTVYLVSSGSEANELALRIARTVTGCGDVVVLDGGYHGNTGLLVDVSPYKHHGPGGNGPPPWVHTLPLPDVSRTPADADPGRHADAARGALSASAEGPAAFIVESFPGVAGQIVLPTGYLDAVFGVIRKAGGLCITDEVQVGLGRIGSHWWGFETQGVVPDLVTLGKPLGNGYPLAAVVTTRAIAEAFANGMEFFTSFGGNAVACAVGSAVLDVIEDENLREAATATGAHLVRRLSELARRHPLIGDVRGAGLFLGVELVNDAASPRSGASPAAEQARYIANRARQLGVLISADGIHGNVLKIKPPLVFDIGHADLLVDTLDRIFDEDAAQPQRPDATVPTRP